MTGNRVREGEWHAAKGPGPGVEPGSAAKPWHMGRARYQPSSVKPHFSLSIWFLLSLYCIAIGWTKELWYFWCKNPKCLELLVQVATFWPAKIFDSLTKTRCTNVLENGFKGLTWPCLVTKGIYKYVLYRNGLTWSFLVIFVRKCCSLTFYVLKSSFSPLLSAFYTINYRQVVIRQLSPPSNICFYTSFVHETI